MAAPGQNEALTANGIKIYVRTWGSRGPTLVLLTGLGSPADTFDELAAEFVDRFRVIGLTRRGQPPSDCPPSGYDLATLVDDVSAVLDTVNVDRAHFVAHSLGGLELTELALRRPHQVSSLVLLDAGFDPASAFKIFARDPLAAPDADPTSVSAQIDQWWRQYTPSYSKISAPTLSIYALQSRHPDNPPDIVDERTAAADAYWRSVVDPWVREQARAFGRQVPHAQVVILDEASHYLYKDARTRLVPIMREFYDRISAW
jgi:pimeloyl-ACP methyl ester carboxylesterase